MLRSLEQKAKAYADARWPDRDMAWLIRKLGEEFGELAEAVSRRDETSIRIEAADATFILMDMLALKGDSLTQWVTIKVGILEARLECAESKGREAHREEASCS